MTETFKSFYKTVQGGEGEKCKYPTRLDTFGCGCSHDCSYCYAKSLLSFRNLWNPDEPKVADIKDICKVLDDIEPGTIIRLGGMTDCFQPAEREYQITRRTIQEMNKRKIGYLIVTKSAMVAEYTDILDKDLAHIQITVTTLDDEKAAEYEKASPPSERIKAILFLQEQGYDVAIRLSPLIDEFMDYEKLNSLGINKAIVEFLRANHWIKKWFKLDYSIYALSNDGYEHLPLYQKQKIIKKIKIPSISVCEDVKWHYNYWKNEYNPNPEDCCNLRRQNG